MMNREPWKPVEIKQSQIFTQAVRDIKFGQTKANGKKRLEGLLKKTLYDLGLLLDLNSP